MPRREIRNSQKSCTVPVYVPSVDRERGRERLKEPVRLPRWRREEKREEEDTGRRPKGARTEHDTTTTTPRKARSHESHPAATKKCLLLLEINSSQRDAALCSAALAQVPEHQRLDARPLGASQHAKNFFF